jgi:hypothetical protein
MFKQLEQRVTSWLTEPPDEQKSSRRAILCSQLATLYLLTEDQKWADLAAERVQAVLDDPISQDRFSRGLTRAMILQQLAITYDFCYAGWKPKTRKLVNQAIFELMDSTNSNMGWLANYSIASNWMGVRYGAVVFAASVWDDPLLAEGERSRAEPLLWDALNRLRDHVEANLFENGWNGESMGYHAYNWSFVAPALIALQEGSRENPVFELTNFVPKARNTLWGIITSAVDIEGQKIRGLKADLSDDNLRAFSPDLLATGMRLAPPDQLPYLKWAFDYRFSPDDFLDDRNGLLHSLLFYPDSVEARNPEEAGWLHYHDPEQGVAIFRNRFADESDIVFTLSATSRRVRGHQGPDTHTWRLLGLGVPWVIGGGRTNATHLQTNLYPSPAQTPLTSKQELGELLAHEFTPTGGYTISAGSCLGVENHQRKAAVSYHPDHQAEAVFLMQERSDNGRRWRLQTPEFNEISILPDGYQLTAPNGSTLRVKVLAGVEEVAVETGLHRYGGETVRLNPGIRYQGEAYPNSRWIDIACEGELTLLISLQAAGKVHPEVQEVGGKGWRVGNKELFLPVK